MPDHLSQLRLIAVHVEEPKTGVFAWVLTEREGNAWSELDRSSAPTATYQEAMAGGLLALQGRIDNLKVGPRKPSPSVEAEHGKDGETLSQEPASTGAVPPRKSAFFGFGPVR